MPGAAERIAAAPEFPRQRRRFPLFVVQKSAWSFMYRQAEAHAAPAPGSGAGDFSKEGYCYVTYR